MRAGLRLVVFVAALIVCAPVSADYQRAVDAIERDDLKTALREAQEGAEQGDPRAQRLYGYMLMNGKGTKADRAAGARWLRLAAENGDTVAQRELGAAYLGGLGVPKDPAEASRWFLQAAQKGDVIAQFMAAMLYRTGLGVAKDEAESARWLRKAAEQGDPSAQSVLAGYYRRGVGVEKDLLQAYVWISLAAKAKEPKAAAIKKEIAKDLTPEQKKEGDRQVRAWKPAPSASASAETRLKGTGTGFVVSGQGHVVTNEHVVRGCQQLRVRGLDENLAPAKLVAASRQDDLALLKVEYKPAVVAPFRSRELRPGDAVVAFGFPMSGLLASSGNLTVGNVTALVGTRNDERFLQTSTPIQPGNSGGPLLDMNGRVVGVTTSSIPSLQNVNFAVKGGVAAVFLDKHGVAVADTGGSSRAMKAADVGARAKRFTVRIECRA
ncbi:MAG: trypsin-like peptidase domain-containing protein [Rhodospirillaceae bacterium]|nr:trypsin-like peptidase domain-containing protein [Rhodospirillaceae bacterium]